MVLTLFKIFSDVRKIITALITGLIEFVTKNPVLSEVIVLMLVSNYATYHFTEASTEARVKKEDKVVIDHLTAQVDKANKDITARNEKIDQLEKSSKKDADDAAATIAAKEAELSKAEAKYKADLLKAKITSYDVFLPPKKEGDKPVAVTVQMENGQVVCNRFPSTYMTTINDMIDIINKPVIIPVAEISGEPK